MTAVLPPDQDQPPGRGPASSAQRRWTIAAALTAAVAVVAAVVWLLVPTEDPEQGAAPAPVPTTASASPTGAATSAPATTGPTAQAPTTAAPSPTAAPVVPPDAVSAVWPTAASGIRYLDPVAAARGFATELVGFVEPVVGEFLAGDNRSGEVELRARAAGPVTTVVVRRLADDTWWVLGAATADVQLDQPGAGDLVTSPLTLTGRALAFEGHVSVRIVDDSGLSPLATGFVTGGGDELRPFTGTFPLDQPRTDHGAVVLTTESAEDGRVWSASVVRIGFVR